MVYVQKETQVAFATLEDPSQSCLLAVGKGYPRPPPAWCRLSRSATGMGEEGPLFLARYHRQIWSAHDHSHTLTCSNKATFSP